MLIELHLLQSFPVSNLNRDDLGQPKTARFGGYTRARISSQALKRAARRLFATHGLQPTDLGIHTKRLCELAAAIYREQQPDVEPEDALDIMRAGFAQLGYNTSGEGLGEYLISIDERVAPIELEKYCRQHANALTKQVHDKRAKLDKEKQAAARKRKDSQQERQEAAAQSIDFSAEAKKADKAQPEARALFDGSRAADIALFGRMVATNADFNVTAASQVAHALSTHTVANDFDYYTALDDKKPEDSKGADMIGTVDFNTACYYRYANLDIAQLRANLTDRLGEQAVPDEQLTRRAAGAWINAFIHAVPGGKQNSMAARNLPDSILAVVRTDSAWSLANAFLKPVDGATDLMDASTRCMTSYFRRLRTLYGSQDLRHIAYATMVEGEDAKLTGELIETAPSVAVLVDGVLAAAGLATSRG